MNRYLVTISYIGTSFNGIKRIPPYYYFGDQTTIIGKFELALTRTLKLNRKIEGEGLSRTDAGVHALQTSAAFDLEHQDGQPYDPSFITTILNQWFARKAVEIRVINTEIVPHNFDYRCIEQRTYLYRLAVPRKEYVRNTNQKLQPWWTPMEELDRCFFVRNFNFDIHRMLEVAPMFVGKHDFQTFMRPSKEEKTKRISFTIRTITSLTIDPGKPCVMLQNRDKCAAEFDYWHFRITASSFIYRQIRRIIGTLVGVATGELTKRDVYEMLTIPSRSWKVQTAPAAGLYLLNVRYKENSKSFVEDDVKVTAPELKEIPCNT